MLNRLNASREPLAGCAVCREAIVRVRGAVLLLVAGDRPGVVIAAEIDHERCAGAHQLASGTRLEVIPLSGLTNDAKSRETLRQRARAQAEPVAATIIRAIQMGYRESMRLRAPGATKGPR